jgi:MFS family permease
MLTKIRADRASYKWILVAVLFLAGSLNYADRGALSAVFPLLREDLGTSDMALAAVGSFFLWSYAFCSPLAGYLGDRFSRSALVTWSVATWSLVTALTALVRSTEQLLAMRVLLGITESLYIPASIALIAEHHPARSRATAMALHLTGIHAGVVLGGTVAGYLGERHGWRSSQLALGLGGLLLSSLCWLALLDKRSPASEGETASGKSSEKPAAGVFGHLLKTPSYWILLTEAMLLAVGVWIFANWLPLYFTETFSMSLSGSGFAGTFPIQAGGVMGTLAGGYLSDLVARKGVEKRMLFHSLCYLAAAPLLLTFVMSGGYAAVMAAIFGYSLLRTIGAVNANPLLCDVLPANSWSKAIGLMNACNCFAGGAGILIAGYLKRDFGLAGVFAGISAIVLVAGVLLLVGYRVFLPKDLNPALAAAKPKPVDVRAH